MTVTDTTSISDLIMGVSPTLLNLLSSPMNKADIIDGYQKGIPMWRMPTWTRKMRR